MKLILRIVAIIYRGYDDKGADIPYFRTITTIVLVLFLHMVHIGLFLRIPSSIIIPWNSDASKPMQYLFSFIYFGIIIVIISILFKKSKLEKINITQRQIDIGRKILPIYLMVSILLLVVLLVKSGIEKGKINF